MTVTLRPIGDGDRDFLSRLYASTRAEELAHVPWPEAQKAAFLQMQFEAQHAHYQQYTQTRFEVILVDGEPAGRLYVRRADDEIRIVDIALLPAHRNSGIGGSLLRELVEEARTARLPLHIHVEKNNPALRLYERLGFRQIDDRGVYWFLEKAP